MLFVRTFDHSYLWEDISKEIKKFVDCGADVIIRYKEGAPRMRAEIVIDPMNVHEFLACVSKTVDEHTLEAWEHDWELAQQREPEYRKPRHR